MFRSIFNAGDSLAKSVYNVSNSSVCVQCVRWRRKPRWIPVAKSRVFKVPEKTKVPEDERVELLRLHNNYKTQMRSLRAFFREEVEQKKAVTSDDHIVVSAEQEEAEFQRMKSINDEWNMEITKIRDARLAKEYEERREFIAERVELKIARDQEQYEKIEQRVRNEKENSKSFITRDNIDQAIEFALANPVDYNFSIDLQGNIYNATSEKGNVVKSEEKSLE
ncbi:unnamed protein product [Diamesa serratosioi]